MKHTLGFREALLRFIDVLPLLQMKPGCSYLERDYKCMLFDAIVQLARQAVALLKHRKLDRDDDKDLKAQGKQFVRALKAEKANRKRADRSNAVTDEKDGSGSSPSDSGDAEKSE